MRRRSRIVSAATYTVAVIAAIVTLFPLYWLFAMSLMPAGQAFSRPPTWFFVPTLESYHAIFTSLSLDIGRFIGNSLVVATATTVMTLVIVVPGSYATARFAFRGQPAVAASVLVTRMLPPIAMVVPLYLYLGQLGLIDSRSGLTLVYVAINIPFAFWMLLSFFRTVPSELTDAALVDGCSELSALWRVIVPVSAPGLVAAGVFSFILAWNDFAIAAVVTAREAVTLPLLVNSFQSPEGTEWGMMAAGASIAILPPIVLFSIVQRWMVRGLTVGAVKA